MSKEINLSNGKYRFLQNKEGLLTCRRYDEAWRAFVGDKAVGQLFDYAFELQSQLTECREEIEAKRDDVIRLMSLAGSQAKNIKKQAEEIKGLKAEREQAIIFLNEALPHIECTNHFQNGLITAIGTFLQTITDKELDRIGSIRDVPKQALTPKELGQKTEITTQPTKEDLAPKPDEVKYKKEPAIVTQGKKLDIQAEKRRNS